MRIARIKGVDIRVSPVFIILAVVGACLGYLTRGLLIVLAVLFHEASHLVTAALLGYRIREVELFSAGGLVRVAGLFQLSPAREIAISVMGPVANLVLAFFAVGSGLNRVIGVENSGFFVAVNMVIGLFNLLPALPLDGGRILRALLSYRWGLVKATGIATALGKATAVSLLATALWRRDVDPLGITMAMASVFLFFAAGAERKMAASLMISQVNQKKRQLFIQGALKCRNIAAACQTGAREVMEGFLPGYYHIVFVIGEKGEVLGEIGEDEIIKGVMEKGYSISIGEILGPR